MRKIWIAATVAATVVGGGAALPTVAAATPVAAPGAAPVVTTPETSMSFVSQPGDFVGRGRTAAYLAPDADITVTGTAASVTFTVRQGDDFWQGNVAAGAGDTLHPGRYVGAERFPFQTGRNAGVSFYGNGAGCNTVSGSFLVNQIAIAPSGAVTLADITFVQHCERARPALTGTLRFNALPLSYRQRSDAGDYVGAGVDRVYLNGGSVFRASVTVGSVTREMQFGVSGRGDQWTGLFSPPTGADFVPGRTYPTLGRSPDATHAGMYFFGNGRACNAPEGTIRVDRLVVSGSTITALNLTFVQRCAAGAPALRGTMRYYA